VGEFGQTGAEKHQIHQCDQGCDNRLPAFGGAGEDKDHHHAGDAHGTGNRQTVGGSQISDF